MIDLRIGLSLVTGLGVGALAALSAAHASVSGTQATALGAASVAVAALGLVAAFWLDEVRPREPNGALVVFLLFAALGLLLGAGGHGGH